VHVHDISNSMHHWNGLEELAALGVLEAKRSSREPSPHQCCQLCQCFQVRYTLNEHRGKAKISARGSQALIKLTSTYWHVLEPECNVKTNNERV
jgi:hypothetical protein